MRERPNNERCNFCDEWHPEGIENYVEHLKNCKHIRKALFEAKDEINSYLCRGNPYEDDYKITGIIGLKQTFAVYIKDYSNWSEYCHKKIVQFTRIGAVVNLNSFYDMGRIPLTFGGNGRVMWVGQKGSKWLTFRTWDYFRWCVLERDNGTCKQCGKVISTKNDKGLWLPADFVCDHIIPLCRDGKDWWEDPEMTNFQTLCVTCNKIKTKNDMANLVVNRKLTKAIGKNGFLLTSF